MSTDAAARRDRFGGVLAAAASLQFGVIVVVGKRVLERGMTVESMLAFRFWVAASLLVLVLVALRRPVLAAPGERVGTAALAVFGYGVEATFFFTAAPHGRTATDRRGSNGDRLGHRAVVGRAPRVPVPGRGRRRRNGDRRRAHPRRGRDGQSRACRDAARATDPLTKGTPIDDRQTGAATGRRASQDSTAASQRSPPSLCGACPPL